jgi:processive 1,2-diacylglycerol beta-glucosyltransferase
MPFPMSINELDVKVFDILDFGRIHFDGNHTASMFTGPTRPIYDVTWRYWLTGRFLWGGGTVWSRIMFPAFTKWVRDTKPVAIVCTHITAANVALGARMITHQDFPIICVPTDYEVEGMWPHKYTDLFCVATESMAETLRARKVDDSRIVLTGIPARHDFKEGYDLHDVRETWNIPQDKNIVLVLAGATLPQPYVRMREILDASLKYLKDIDDLYMLFLTGSDTNYMQQLRKRFDEEGVKNAMALGYTDDIARLMSVSDFIVCKPGGLTVTECLCTETPMLLVGRAYGQEKANVKLLTSLGAAMHVETSRELGNAVRYLTRNKAALKAMLANEEYLRRPDAAAEIAMASLQLAIAQQDDATKARREKKHFLRFYWGKQPAHTR